MQQLQLPKRRFTEVPNPLWERLDTLDTLDTGALSHGPTH